eukprot:1160552-Pelagomonas_calceolata.AAC.10
MLKLEAYKEDGRKPCARFIHKHTHAQACTHTHARTHTHTHAHAQISTCTCTHARTHTHARARAHKVLCCTAELDVSECGADARGVSALVDVLAASSVSSAMSQHKGLSMFSPVGE